MYLFFDTETTGLPKNKKAPITDTQNWPRMVQLAMLLFTTDGSLVEKNNFIVKQDGYKIPSEVAKLHGITTERALKEGTELKNVLDEFLLLKEKTTVLVSHNMEFDKKVLGCEFYRMTKHDPLEKMKKFCTMTNKKVINLCALPTQYGSYKWPKLSELHSKLFGVAFEEAHNASVDIEATARCFFELKKRKII